MAMVAECRVRTDRAAPRIEAMLARDRPNSGAGCPRAFGGRIARAGRVSYVLVRRAEVAPAHCHRHRRLGFAREVPRRPLLSRSESRP